jgi:hypothetical protein
MWRLTLQKTGLTVILTSYETVYHRLGKRDYQDKALRRYNFDAEYPPAEVITLSNVVFNRVILDEGHRIRHPHQAHHRLVAALKCDYLNVVTATPLLNTAQDLLGYLRLAWPMSGVDIPNPRLKVMWRRHRAKLFAKNWDPAPMFTGDDDIVKITWLANGKEPFWMAHPKLYWHFGAAMRWDSTRAEMGWAQSKVLSFFEVRRTMYTPVQLPDGTTTSAGASIPPPTVEMEVCRLPATGMAEVSEKIERRVRACDRVGFARTRLLHQISFDGRNIDIVEDEQDIPNREETEKLIEEDFDGGASYIFQRTCLDPTIPFLSDRKLLATYLMAKSPVLARIVHLVVENKLNKETTIVYAIHPWTCQ